MIKKLSGFLSNKYKFKFGLFVNKFQKLISSEAELFKLAKNEPFEIQFIANW